MIREGHGRGMASMNQTRPHCVNQMGKIHYKPLAARHGRETAWARHAMCESAFKVTFCDVIPSVEGTGERVWAETVFVRFKVR